LWQASGAAHDGRMHPHRIRRGIALALFVSVLAVTPARADDAVKTSGSCSGRGSWVLITRRQTTSTIKVRFTIEHVAAGSTWQLFLSDNGVRILATTKTAGSDGEVRASKITADRSGVDHIKASGVNLDAGGSCAGSLAF
jgi:hypothetical protein